MKYGNFTTFCQYEPTCYIILYLCRVQRWRTQGWLSMFAHFGQFHCKCSVITQFGGAAQRLTDKFESFTQLTFSTCIQCEMWHSWKHLVTALSCLFDSIVWGATFYYAIPNMTYRSQFPRELFNNSQEQSRNFIDQQHSFRDMFL